MTRNDIIRNARNPEHAQERLARTHKAMQAANAAAALIFMRGNMTWEQAVAQAAAEKGAN